MASRLLGLAALVLLGPVVTVAAALAALADWLRWRATGRLPW